MTGTYRINGENVEIPDELVFIMRGASRMVGKALNLLEMTLTPGTQTFTDEQIEKVKQELENILYGYRDAVLKQIITSQILDSEE